MPWQNALGFHGITQYHSVYEQPDIYKAVPCYNLHAVAVAHRFEYTPIAHAKSLPVFLVKTLHITLSLLEKLWLHSFFPLPFSGLRLHHRFEPSW